MSDGAFEIDVRNAQQLSVERSLVQAAARATLELAGGSIGVPHERVQVSILLTDDAHIAALNGQYRGVDEPTDVLAFPQGAEEADEATEAVMGDVVVSVQRAYEQAAEAGREPRVEICELVAHGVLHLLGLTDETPAGREQMQRRQRAVLARLRVQGAE